jgi:hypothetical protein
VEWLHRYDIPYDAIHFDKPLYDVMVDDRSKSVEELEQMIGEEKIY